MSEPTAAAVDPAAGATLVTATPAAPALSATPAAVDPATQIFGKDPAAVDPAADPAKVAADKATADAAAAAAAKAAAVPEKYEFKAPEGVTLDQAQVDAFSPIAKELGLTQDQAQKLVDFQIARGTQATTEHAAAVKALVDGWADQTRADKEIGGVKFAENVGLATQALDKFGTPALRKALDDSGMGNHPEVVRFLSRVGATTKEDGFASGNNGGGNSQRSAASVLFPDLK